MGKTKECPSCGLEVEAEENVCHYCGYEFPRQPAIIKIVAILLILLFLLYFVF